MPARDLIAVSRIARAFERGVDVFHLLALVCRIKDLVRLGRSVALNDILGSATFRAAPTAHEFVSHRDKISHLTFPLSIADVGGIAQIVDRVNHRLSVLKQIGVVKRIAKREKISAGAARSSPANRREMRGSFKAHSFVRGLKLHVHVVFPFLYLYNHPTQSNCTVQANCASVTNKNPRDKKTRIR